MNERRPLTEEERAENLRLKAIFDARKASAKSAGRKLTQADIAEECGWSGQSAVSQFTTGRIPLNLDALLRLSKALKFRPEEVSPRLARLIGSIPSAQSAVAEQTLVNASVWDDETPLGDEEVEVPFLREVELAAGNGRTVIEESSDLKLRFGRQTLRKHNVQAENAVCVVIHGNSMEPRLPHGSTVSVDRGATSIIDGKLYALSHSGQLRVKQLYRLPGGGLRLRSFNREEYEDEDFTADEAAEQEISIIGRVWWGAMFF
ncbi:helix-turn-helix transcriptional regulator [Pseudomonadaceae bacterium T75]|nr:helix-turn-helix transcriptional regulator [Pseudomonadaceae bacterium T75]